MQSSSAGRITLRRLNQTGQPLDLCVAVCSTGVGFGRQLPSERVDSSFARVIGCTIAKCELYKPRRGRGMSYIFRIQLLDLLKIFGRVWGDITVSLYILCACNVCNTNSKTRSSSTLFGVRRVQVDGIPVA